MSTKKIRIAQVGTNSMTHGAQTLDSILKHGDLYEFVGIAEPADEWKHNLDTPRYRAVPQYTVEELLQIDGLDAVSIGPDIADIHTTEETLSISSTERVYRYVRTFVERKKQK